MKPVSVAQLVSATGGTLLQGDGAQLFTSAGSDSRCVTEGMLFVPIKGENADGHRFIDMALEKGAAGCICHEKPEKLLPGKFYVLVQETRLALKGLASWYRDQFAIPFVQITGSVGKTTTKEMIASVLSQHYCVLKTEGNFNNDLGVPWTLLRLADEHQAAVIETGMDHFGEIRYLGEMIRPDVAVISNIGEAHIEFLGSREGILQAKCEIFDYLKKDGFAVLNGDDELLNTVRRDVELLRCGEGEGCTVRVTDVRDLGLEGVDCRIESAGESWDVHIPTPGRHMIYAASMAAVIGQRLGLTGEEIVRGIAAYEPAGSRMRLHRLYGRRMVLDDCYNASPKSVASSLQVLKNTDCDRRVAVLGDMNELGDLTEQGHRDMGTLCGELDIDILFAIGEKSRAMAAAAKEAGVPDVRWFANKNRAMDQIAASLGANTAMLIKASHSLGFEWIVQQMIPKEGNKD